jgi:hypothetical protein
MFCEVYESQQQQEQDVTSDEQTTLHKITHTDTSRALQLAQEVLDPFLFLKRKLQLIKALLSVCTA